MKELVPFSIRILKDDRDKLPVIGKDLGESDTAAGGIRALISFYEKNKKLQDPEEEQIRNFEINIAKIKNSKFPYDPKEIKLLEDGLEKAKSKLVQKNMDALKGQLKLLNSIG